MAFWTLVFAVIAAVAGSLVARWEWLDRPQHAWRFRTSRYRRQAERSPHQVTMWPVDINDPHHLDVEIYAEGSALVHGVRARATGCSILKAPNGETASRMTAGSDPIELKVALPPASEGDAFIEVVWIRLRPRRHYGERMNLRTREIERWRWRWRSVRLRKREHERWWRYRPTRTRGRWVAGRRPPLVTIPETTGPVEP